MPEPFYGHGSPRGKRGVVSGEDSFFTTFNFNDYLSKLYSVLPSSSGFNATEHRPPLGVPRFRGR